MADLSTFFIASLIFLTFIIDCFYSRQLGPVHISFRNF